MAANSAASVVTSKDGTSANDRLTTLTDNARLDVDAALHHLRLLLFGFCDRCI
jgi:hypothetical protein